MCLHPAAASRSSRWVSKHKESLDYLERKEGCRPDGTRPVSRGWSCQRKSQRKGGQAHPRCQRKAGHGFCRAMLSSWGTTVTYQRAGRQNQRALVSRKNPLKNKQNQELLELLHIT